MPVDLRLESARRVTGAGRTGALETDDQERVAISAHPVGTLPATALIDVLIVHEWAQRDGQIAE